MQHGGRRTGIENIKEYFGLAYVITGVGRKINHCYSKSNVYLERDEAEGKFFDSDDSKHK